MQPRGFASQNIVLEMVEIGPTPEKKRHPEGVHLSSRFRSEPSSLITFLCSSWSGAVAAGFYQHIQVFPPCTIVPAPPGEPWGAPGLAGIYNPSSKSLALTSTFALKGGRGGATRRQPNQTVGPHRPAPLRGSRRLLPLAVLADVSSSFHLQGLNGHNHLLLFPHEAEIDENFQTAVSSPRPNFFFSCLNVTRFFLSSQ